MAFLSNPLTPIDDLMNQTGTTPEERHFLVNGLKLAAKVWNAQTKTERETKRKTGVIALHGWLDNANSFDPLAPLLEDLCIVALDSPGHGNSDFRSADASYLIWSEVDEVIQVANQLGWDKFVLMGHSRGAGIVSIIAGTFPERISHLILLEGGIPLPMGPQEAPENLAKSIELTQQLSNSKGTLFPTREAAIAARADGFTKVEQQTAEILAQRSLDQEDGGFRWRADARLKAPSAFKLGDAQIDAFLSRISAPTLLVIGKNGIIEMMDFTHSHFEQIDDLHKIELAGRHHLHMEGAEKAISEEIKTLLSAS